MYDNLFHVQINKLIGICSCGNSLLDIVKQ